MRPSDETFNGEMSIQRWVSDSFPSGIHQVADSNLVMPGEEQIDLKMQCLLSVMELALRCTLVKPDARISMKDALSTLKKGCAPICSIASCMLLDFICWSC
ncbi:hypothetical protein RDI58_014563 [Solanum bulbocastanum]|uniref:Uncharacterized protein n=1 Tax=Solanum bulbocastanum TaxID=147425 RepID=A0AAN8TJV6_SOLBU